MTKNGGPAGRSISWSFSLRRSQGFFKSPASWIQGFQGGFFQRGFFQGGFLLEAISSKFILKFWKKKFNVVSFFSSYLLSFCSSFLQLFFFSVLQFFFSSVLQFFFSSILLSFCSSFLLFFCSSVLLFFVLLFFFLSFLLSSFPPLPLKKRGLLLVYELRDNEPYAS
jgi:hypothetical protein